MLNLAKRNLVNVLSAAVTTLGLGSSAVIAAIAVTAVGIPAAFASDSIESSAEDVLVLNGKLTQGALVRGQVPAGAMVFLNDAKVETNRAGKFVIGFEREAPLSQQLRVELPTGEAITRTLTLQKREYNIQRIDGLEQKMVTPPAEVTARIKRDNINVANARSSNTDIDALFTRFEWPATGPISGVYGSQRILNGVPKWPHYGVDIAGPTGTPVYAPVDGIVTLADDLYYSGNTLILDHGMTVFSTFLHLDTITVSVGDKVKQGEQIGTIGSTGRSTGPHLDWRINLGKVRLDPQTVVTGSPESSEN